MPQAQADTSVILRHPRLVRIEEHRRSFIDERRRVDWHLYEYRGSDGEEYRKSFEVRPGDIPKVPDSGTHDEINGYHKQW